MSSQLETLKNIAELLNQSTSRRVLSEVLQAFISMTQFETGWIFLEQGGVVKLEADVGLPPALKRNDKELMCGEDCHCVSRYKNGRLTQATNIIACKRIEKAREQGSGETCGVTHHATVPLQTPNRLYGLFNVAARNRENYTEDLELLESIALQMGTALERIERFEKEEERNTLLTKAHLFTRKIQEARDSFALQETVQEGMEKLFPSSKVRINKQAEYDVERLQGWINRFSFLNISADTPFSIQEREIFELLMEYIKVSWKQLLLSDKEKDIARREERGRLAQDLHDSVNQLLFSIVLTSKAAEGTADKDSPLYEQISYIHELSAQALAEMRSLIAKQKGERLEAGVFTELSHYAATIGIQLKGQSSGTSSIPYAVEEALLRIGQEALHNVHKHSGVKEVELHLVKHKNKVQMTIKDHGSGFDYNEAVHTPSFGLSGMEQRTASYKGQFEIQSEKGKGTQIFVDIPFEVNKDDD